MSIYGTLLRGTIDWFNGNPEKRFGVAVLDGESGETVFLHMNQAKKISVEITSDKPTLTYSATGRIPKPGERIVCFAEMGTKGLKASKWSFEETYEKAVKHIEARPIYRIMRTSVSSGTPLSEGEPDELWRGTSARFTDRSLEQHYHPVYDRNPFHHDDIFSAHKFWEESHDKGETWEECECPIGYAMQFDARGRRTIPG